MASPIDDSFAQSLAAASNQYLVSRGDEKTVVASYHWFGDWGRDTMIAFPGLTLSTDRPEVAKNILLERPVSEPCRGGDRRFGPVHPSQTIASGRYCRHGWHHNRTGSNPLRSTNLDVCKGH